MSHTSPSATQETAGCHVRASDHPTLGRVLEVVLSGHQVPDFWEGVRGVLREEIARRIPQYLVLDLRTLDCIVGSSLLGGLVAGALEMEKQGKPERTRILAAGGMAGRLAEVLRLCKLEPVLGGVHADLASALAGPR